MTSEIPDVPSEADRRFAGHALSSGLSVPDFAACDELGLSPVGFVQGYCVMQWQFSQLSMGMQMNSPYRQSGRGSYAESYRCPHGFAMTSAEHRSWGQNYEQTWVESSWREGFSTAYRRMMEEAGKIGAHGVIAVVDREEHLSDTRLIEFKVHGTAVVVEGSPRPKTPWSTYLAGQRLVKLIEAGWMPISVLATLASVRVWAYCVTEFLLRGQSYAFGMQIQGTEIEQLSRAHLAVRSIARERMRSQLFGDELHGVALGMREFEFGEGDLELQCTMKGTRVRRFKDFDPMAPPRPTVNLRD